MNDQRDRERFHRAIDRTMGGVTGDPFLPARVMAAARKKEGVNPMKYKHLIALALAALLCLSVAVASELLSGTVDWDGNVTPHDTSLMAPQPTSEPAELERARLMAQFESAHRAKEGELVVVTDLVKGGQGSNRVSLQEKNWETFKQLMADSDIPLPVGIPDGCTLVNAAIHYDCRADGAYRLIDTVESEDGFRAETYVLDAENAVITGYRLTLADNMGQRIDVYAMLGMSSEDSDLMAYDVMQVRAAEVPGMEKAVVMAGESNQLVMYSRLPEPVAIRFRNDVNPFTYEEAYICVYGTAPAEAMLTFFGGK